MSIIETEIWKPNPERPGTLVFDSQRVARDIFTELEAHLKADGRLPDEYFLFDSNGNWRNGALFPKNAEILCNVNYGGSEGVYLDIAVRYEKESYEYMGMLDGTKMVKRMVTEHFATGKTLGESIDDLDKMNLVASSVMAAFYGNESQIKKRYANIEEGNVQRIYPLSPGEQEDAEVFAYGDAVYKAQAINGEIACFDLVISTGNSDYPFLVGEVNAVDKLGSPDHHSGNPHDDVFVDFQSDEYSESRIKEIEQHFSNLYGKPIRFEDLSLDNVRMPPNSLISISSEKEMAPLLKSRKAAEAFCKTVIDTFGEPKVDLHAALMLRVKENYADYNASLLCMSKKELVDMAAKIHATSDAYSYMTAYHTFSDNELQFYLQFQNPLEVVADDWHERNIDTGDVGDVISYQTDTKDALVDYPLIKAEFDEPVDDFAEPPKEPRTPGKEKSAFERGLERGKAKAEADKAQKASEPTKNIKNKEAIE